MKTGYKKTREKHFTEKSAARVVAYARRDGASDMELMRYIIEAFGLRNVSCLVSQSLLVLTNKMFVDSMMTALVGVLGMMKGFKIIAEGRISWVTVMPLDHFFRIYFPRLSEYYGAFVLFVSTGITATSTMMVFIDTMADQAEYYLFLDEVCSAEQMANPFPIDVKPPNFELFYQEDQAEKDMYERWGSLADQIFPDNLI
jgi:low affinity Fe/Cu permease